MSADKNTIPSYQDWNLIQKNLKTLSDMLSAGKITPQKHDELRGMVLNGVSPAELLE